MTKMHFLIEITVYNIDPSLLNSEGSSFFMRVFCKTVIDKIIPIMYDEIYLNNCFYTVILLMNYEKQ